MWTMCPQGENGTAVTDVVTKSVWQKILLFVLLLCSLSSVLSVCVRLR